MGRDADKVHTMMSILPLFVGLRVGARFFEIKTPDVTSTATTNMKNPTKLPEDKFDVDKRARKQREDLNANINKLQCKTYLCYVYSV